MIYKETVTQWKGLRTPNVSEIILNTNRISNLQALGSGSIFKYFMDPLDRREKSVDILTDTTPAEIIFTMDEEPSSSVMELLAYPNNDITATPVTKYIRYDDLVYAFAYEDDATKSRVALHNVRGVVIVNNSLDEIVYNVPFFNDLDMLYAVVDGNIVDGEGLLDVELLHPCCYFDGSSKFMTRTDLMTPNEVEITFKTTSLARMCLVACGNEFNSIQLASGYILAGGATVTGNAIQETYNDGEWHTIKLVSTASANVFDIYFDGVLGTKTSSGNWRTATKTYIGGATTNSLPFTGHITSVIFRDALEVATNEYIFVEGNGSDTLYDIIGSSDFDFSSSFAFQPVSGAADHRAQLSLVNNKTNNTVIVPYHNGSPRDLSAEIFTTVIQDDISNLIPMVPGYGIDFNPNASGDSDYDIWDKSDAAYYNELALVGEYGTFIFGVEDLERSVIMTWMESAHSSKIFTKLSSFNDSPYAIESILVYGTNHVGTDQQSILFYTGDYGRIADDSGDDMVLAVFERDEVRTDMKGGLGMRFKSPYEDGGSVALGQIFADHSMVATFVGLRPAQWNAGHIAEMAVLQAQGHDVGLWFDVSNVCIQLHADESSAEYLALDAAVSGVDEFGCPLKGIAEVFTYSGDTYLGLIPQMRYKLTDAILKPIDGTDLCEITNLPYSASLYEFYVLMPVDALIPVAMQGKYVSFFSPSDQTVVNRQFPIRGYAYFTMAQMGWGTFTNPGGATVVATEVGLQYDQASAPYSSGLRGPAQTNEATEWARYYIFKHAIDIFAIYGLSRPFTVGESHNSMNAVSNGTGPLKELGYTSGGIEPLHNGHTPYMKDSHRFQLATVGSANYGPIDDNSEYDNAIMFDPAVSQWTPAQAFQRMVHNYAKNRFIMERQVSNYTATEHTLWDDLLTLAEAAGIEVWTQTQISTYLFDGKFPVNINPIPDVSVDLNSDGIPDGYQALAAGVTWNLSGPGSTGQLFRSTTGELFDMQGVGGIAPGRVNMSLWLYGKIGDVVVLTITKMTQSYESETRPDWTYVGSAAYTYTFNIVADDIWAEIVPEERYYHERNVVGLNITATLTKGGTAGTVYCGQLSMKR